MTDIEINHKLTLELIKSALKIAEEISDDVNIKYAVLRGSLKELLKDKN